MVRYVNNEKDLRDACISRTNTIIVTGKLAWVLRNEIGPYYLALCAQPIAWNPVLAAAMTLWSRLSLSRSLLILILKNYSSTFSMKHGGTECTLVLKNS